jgi:hypothetical protein
MISAGNEDDETWTKILKNFKQACPIISEQGFSNDCDDGEILHLF